MGNLAVLCGTGVGRFLVLRANCSMSAEFLLCRANAALDITVDHGYDDMSTMTHVDKNDHNPDKKICFLCPKVAS